MRRNHLSKETEFYQMKYFWSLTVHVKNRWLDNLRFYVLFVIISVISVQDDQRMIQNDHAITPWQSLKEIKAKKYLEWIINESQLKKPFYVEFFLILMSITNSVMV